MEMEEAEPSRFNNDKVEKLRKVLIRVFNHSKIGDIMEEEEIIEI
jgi:hypothetical protein